MSTIRNTFKATMNPGAPERYVDPVPIGTSVVLLFVKQERVATTTNETYPWSFDANIP